VTAPASAPAHPQARAERRAALVARSAALRVRMGQLGREFEAPLAAADRAVAALVWLRRHPQIPLALLVFALVARPRRAARLAWRAIALWRGLRAVQRWQRQLRAIAP
jgi:hypothetical protein